MIFSGLFLSCHRLSQPHVLFSIPSVQSLPINAERAARRISRMGRPQFAARFSKSARKQDQRADVGRARHVFEYSPASSPYDYGTYSRLISTTLPFSMRTVVL